MSAELLERIAAALENSVALHKRSIELSIMHYEQNRAYNESSLAVMLANLRREGSVPDGVDVPALPIRPMGTDELRRLALENARRQWAYEKVYYDEIERLRSLACAAEDAQDATPETDE